ncbi:MAG TPA: phage integrase N-terminal SAM-like domain-containing protein [Candidatus Methylomirabilis sp.]|nr:phage integrase N-terminal SAM-like domain-containing protein [Candidatus Methylomirabilis sp.]
MGSARDSAPDPNRASGSARSRWPARVRHRPTSGIAPARPQRPPAGASSRVDPKTLPFIPFPPGVRPLGRQPKLLDRRREALRARHYSSRTEQSYLHCAKRYNVFHDVRHPAEMAEPEIHAFLTRLAMKEKASASTQNQALSTWLFPCRRDLDRQIDDIGSVVRARQPSPPPLGAVGKCLRLRCCKPLPQTEQAAVEPL